MPEEKNKKYAKPEIKKINLDAKIAVLGFCQIGSSSGPHPVGGCSTGPCKAVGS